MYNQISDMPAWIQDYLVTVSGVQLDLIHIDDANGLLDLLSSIA
jgi:hypothetical protein